MRMIWRPSTLTALFACAHLFIEPIEAIQKPTKRSTELNASILVRTHVKRGGYINKNPNYIDPDPNQFMPPKLGDENENHIRRPAGQYQQYGNGNQYYQNQYHTGTSTGTNPYAQPKPILQAIQEYFQRIQQASPTLFYTTVSSIILFFLWQFPSTKTFPISHILRDHFLCSQYNLHRKRYHTLLTSSLSHTTLSHLFMNLYAFITFGKSVKPTLKSNHIPLSAFCVLAAITANGFFVKMHPHGSCLGLSGVALALLAFDARLYPSKEIGFLVRFIPVRLPAHYALVALMVWSILGMGGMMAGSSKDGIAHATHLGGMVFGVVVYELMKKGVWKRWRMKYLHLKKELGRRGYLGKRKRRRVY